MNDEIRNQVAHRLSGCHLRKAGQPIGSGSSASARAKIIAATNSSEIRDAIMALKCMGGFSEKRYDFYVCCGSEDKTIRSTSAGNCNKDGENRISAKLVVASLVATLAGRWRWSIVSRRIVVRSSLGHFRRLVR